MKKISWIAIIGFVLAALLANGAPQPLASPVVPAVAECDCSNLEVLQIELRNAIRLQQAFRNKIPELRAKGTDSSQNALKVFAEGEARRGLESIPDYKGPKEFDYVTWGSNQRTFNFKKEELCRMADSAKTELDKAVAASACDGIGEALRAHEQVHEKLCLSIGYPPYVAMHGADRAQEEVEAYGAQIAVLRAEIAKVLEHSNFRIEFESNTRIQFPPNPAVVMTEIIDNRGVVPMSRAAVSGDLIKLDGEGKQIMNATIEGNCRFTGGLPHTLTVRGSIETDGVEAQIRLTTEGQGPSLKVECTVPGVGKGYGMSMPVTLKSDNVPVINLPLKNGAEQVWDQSTGEAAKMIAQSGAKMSGQAKIRLIFCEK